ncbi:hypothetical protein Q8A67_019475 [Cirrhinus molitorella]|uniref:Uncharacterized protein n=1 Tax=Cirrhinus molitorella TaxID=172907 RepID=A0AA88P798_9TELE|nr:hypothetical protein Q8A67_019475 [Cirrhinus molitorella]
MACLTTSLSSCTTHALHAKAAQHHTACQCFIVQKTSNVRRRQFSLSSRQQPPSAHTEPVLLLAAVPQSYRALEKISLSVKHVDLPFGGKAATFAGLCTVAHRASFSIRESPPITPLV